MTKPSNPTPGKPAAPVKSQLDTLADLQELSLALARSTAEAALAKPPRLIAGEDPALLFCCYAEALTRLIKLERDMAGRAKAAPAAPPPIDTRHLH